MSFNTCKRVLIAWSGGLDSTYLIQQYLERGYSVDVISCNLGPAASNQMKRETKAMDKMLKGYFKDKDVRRIGTSKIILHGDCCSAIALAQPPLWIFNLFSYINRSHDEVAIGYVMNDDAISFLDDIRNLWNSYVTFTCSDVTFPNLVFPLIKYKKNHIWNLIHSDLRKHVTWCENHGGNDRCGECNSCKKMISFNLQDPPPPPESLKLEKSLPKRKAKEPKCSTTSQN